jgi:Tfp pilus assembly PilM family ATPase
MKASLSSLIPLLSRHITVPASIDTRPIGVDFGVSGFRAIGLREDPLGFIPTFSRVVEGDHSIETEEGRMRVLRELKRLRADYRHRYARVTIPESDAYIFTTRLPREALANPEAAIPFKIEENVPIDPREALFSYSFVTGSDSDGKDVQVAVSVVARDTIDKYVNVFAEAGMTLVGILTRNQAASRAIVPDAGCESLLVVNAHDGIADISVIHGHAVHYSATVVLESEQIIDRVHKVLSFWQTRERAHDSQALPEFIMVSGSDGDIEKLKTALAEAVELPVRMANVWKNCVSLSDYVPPIDRVESYKFASAIGCALPNARPC